MDSFGFKTQGINYEKFRPDYPIDFLTAPIQSLKGNKRYLDVATGTGKILFHLNNYFDQAQGIDLSQLMIKSAMIEGQRHQNVKIYKCAATDIQINKEKPYDYITVGEALHFFPVHASLKRIKEALSQEGKLTVYGYIPQPFSNSKKQNDPKNTNDEVLSKFYQKIRAHYKYCYDDLESCYEDKNKYPFHQLFGKVEKQIIQVPVPMTKEQASGYLKTLSAYNHFLVQKPFQKDPILDVEGNLTQNLTLYFEFFKIECSNE